MNHSAECNFSILAPARAKAPPLFAALEFIKVLGDHWAALPTPHGQHKDSEWLSSESAVSTHLSVTS